MGKFFLRSLATVSSNKRKTLYTDVAGWGRFVITAASYGVIGLKLSDAMVSPLGKGEPKKKSYERE